MIEKTSRAFTEYSLVFHSPVIRAVVHATALFVPMFKEILAQGIEKRLDAAFAIGGAHAACAASLDYKSGYYRACASRDV